VKRLAVLGHPVAHSRSPAMQNAALEALGLANEWRYEAIDVAPEDLEQRVRAMPAEGFVGANVTIPHKEAALRLADAASREARAIGAANTLSFDADTIHADNTDAGGLIDSLRDLPASPGGIRALVLGAGGAARAVIWALAEEGAVVHVDRVDLWNRTENRAKMTYEELSQHIKLGGAPVDSPRQEDYGIIVNTTSVGLHGEDPSKHLPIDLSKLGGHLVVDLAYEDRPTKLIQAAREAGAHTVDGLEILVRQGARSLKIWTGYDPPLGVMRNAAREGSSR
jgi:shikimate dehydrogenase